MTWAPCPHGVRTRGKKTLKATYSDLLSLSLSFYVYNNAYSYIYIFMCTYIERGMMHNYI